MEITEEQRKKVEEIGKEHDLRFVVLHGSQATGKAQKGSDLDIAILGQQRLSSCEVLEIHTKFAQIFGDNKDRELDLKSLHDAEPMFAFFVTRDGILLYGNRTNYAGFRASAYRGYMDSFDLRALQTLLFKKSIDSFLKAS